MIDQPYEGATPEQLQSRHVQDLLAIHTMFRTQLRGLLDWVQALMVDKRLLNAPETTTRLQTLIRAGTNYASMLHHHHHLETDALFPSLQAAGLEKRVVERLNADHDEIAVMIDQFSESIHQLATIEPAVMQHDLRRLADALHAHLAYEETHICPFLARWSGF